MHELFGKRRFSLTERQRQELSPVTEPTPLFGLSIDAVIPISPPTKIIEVDPNKLVDIKHEVNSQILRYISEKIGRISLMSSAQGQKLAQQLAPFDTLRDLLDEVPKAYKVIRDSWISDEVQTRRAVPICLLDTIGVEKRIYTVTQHLMRTQDYPSPNEVQPVLDTILNIYAFSMQYPAEYQALVNLQSLTPETAVLLYELPLMAHGAILDGEYDIKSTDNIQIMASKATWPTQILSLFGMNKTVYDSLRSHGTAQDRSYQERAKQTSKLMKQIEEQRSQLFTIITDTTNPLFPQASELFTRYVNVDHTSAFIGLYGIVAEDNKKRAELKKVCQKYITNSVEKPFYELLEAVIEEYEKINPPIVIEDTSDAPNTSGQPSRKKQRNLSQPPAATTAKTEGMKRKIIEIKKIPPILGVTDQREIVFPEHEEHVKILDDLKDDRKFIQVINEAIWAHNQARGIYSDQLYRIVQIGEKNRYLEIMDKQTRKQIYVKLEADEILVDEASATTISLLRVLKISTSLADLVD